MDVWDFFKKACFLINTKLYKKYGVDFLNKTNDQSCKKFNNEKYFNIKGVQSVFALIT
jgi:hypothetical protein